MKDIVKLELQLKKLNSKYGKLLHEKREVDQRLAEARHEIEELKNSIQPLRDSINSLSAERSKFVRKLRRHGIDV